MRDEREVQTIAYGDHQNGRFGRFSILEKAGQISQHAIVPDSSCGGCDGCSGCAGAGCGGCATCADP